MNYLSIPIIKDSGFYDEYTKIAEKLSVLMGDKYNVALEVHPNIHHIPISIHIVEIKEGGGFPLE